MALPSRAVQLVSGSATSQGRTNVLQVQNVGGVSRNAGGVTMTIGGATRSAGSVTMSVGGVARTIGNVGKNVGGVTSVKATGEWVLNVANIKTLFNGPARIDVNKLQHMFFSYLL